MAESIEHRLNDLVQAGLYIMSVEGSLSETAEHVSKVSKPEQHIIFLGYFTNRGAEYIIDGLSPEYDNKNFFCQSAYQLALREELFRGDFREFKIQVHAIEDTLINRTFYFTLPHLKYRRGTDLKR